MNIHTKLFGVMTLTMKYENIITSKKHIKLIADFHSGISIVSDGIFADEEVETSFQESPECCSYQSVNCRK